MKRIKIALLLASMDSGGIEKAAVSLLRALPEAEFDVHLILNRKKGVFLKLVPDWVRISELCKSEKYNKRVELGDRKWLVYSLAHLDLASVFNAITHFVYSKFATLDKAIMCRIKQLSKEVKYSDEQYDFVLAYSNNEQLYQAVNFYKTKKVVTWLHRDIDIEQEYTPDYAFLYEKCHKIFGVSQKVVDDFVRCLPQMAGRTSLHYNIIDQMLGIDLARAYQVKRPQKKWWLVTVGRLTEIKGIDVIPEVALKLKNSGIDFVWSVVGKGYLYPVLKKKIKEYSLEDNVIFEGEKENPYPYYSGCDIYVQPSRTEGYCISLAEARMFYKPVVVTDFSGAREQLADGDYGKIVQFGVDTIADGIIEVIDNPELRTHYKESLSKQKIDTTDTIDVLVNYFKTALDEG